ncbi:hypothetical protein ACTXT7_015713 [Hymenolepis weldensis]
MNVERSCLEDNHSESGIYQGNHYESGGTPTVRHSQDGFSRAQPTPPPRRESLMHNGVTNAPESFNPPMPNQDYSHTAPLNSIQGYPHIPPVSMKEPYQIPNLIVLSNTNELHRPEPSFPPQQFTTLNPVGVNGTFAYYPNLPCQDSQYSHQSNFTPSSFIHQTAPSLGITGTNDHDAQPSIHLPPSTVQSSVTHEPELSNPPLPHQRYSYTLPSTHMHARPTTVNPITQSQCFPPHTQRGFDALAASSSGKMVSSIPPASRYGCFPLYNGTCELDITYHPTLFPYRIEIKILHRPNFISEQHIQQADSSMNLAGTSDSATLPPPTPRLSVLHVPATYGQVSLNPPMPKQEYSYAPPQGYMRGYSTGIIPMPQYPSQSHNGADGSATTSYCKMASQNQTAPRQSFCTFKIGPIKLDVISISTHLSYRIQQKSRGRMRKVTSREARAILKAWFNDHIDNPRPTYFEKMHLVTLTGLSKEQVIATILLSI